MIEHKKLIATAHQLAALAASRRAELECTGSLPDDVVASIVHAGFPLALVPRERGGFELDVDVVSDIVRPVAAVNPSLGWNLCFYIGLNWVAAQFPPAFQDAYFAGTAAPLLAGSIVPTFRLEPVAGGFRLSGRASWVSGAPHAAFLACAGPVAYGEASGELRLAMIPRDNVCLIDTWQVEGMRTTGSIDVVADDVFVPEEQTLRVSDLAAGRACGQALYSANPMYARPSDIMPMAYILPVFVGASRGAADALLAGTCGRTNTNTGTPAAAKPAMQGHVGRVQARAQLAEDMLAALIAEVVAGPPRRFDAACRLAFKARAALIVDYCRDTVVEATHAAGANAFRKSAQLQMLFRDISMISLHPFFEIDGNCEAFGKDLLNA